MPLQTIYTHRDRTGICPVCLRPTTRRRGFVAVVSPIRTDPRTHRPLTPEQVREQLEQRADAWVPDFRHGACKAAVA
jgi:hypothetical protein